MFFVLWNNNAEIKTLFQHCLEQSLRRVRAWPETNLRWVSPLFGVLEVINQYFRVSFNIHTGKTLIRTQEPRRGERNTRERDRTRNKVKPGPPVRVTYLQTHSRNKLRVRLLRVYFLTRTLCIFFGKCIFGLHLWKQKSHFCCKCILAAHVFQGQAYF